MESVRQIAGKYWGIYYLIYVAGIAGGVWRYQHRLAGDDAVVRLAAIFAVAAGCVSLVVIPVEVPGRMVLLIPAAVKKLKDMSRKEGLSEGRQSIIAEVQRCGGREDGSIQVTLTPEESNPCKRRPPRAPDAIVWTS